MALRTAIRPRMWRLAAQVWTLFGQPLPAHIKRVNHNIRNINDLRISIRVEIAAFSVNSIVEFTRKIGVEFSRCKPCFSHPIGHQDVAAF